MSLKIIKNSQVSLYLFIFIHRRNSVSNYDQI